MKKMTVKGPATKQVMPHYNAYQTGYGTIPSVKDKLRSRNSKQAKREKHRMEREYTG